MKPQLIAFIFLVTFVISTRAYFLRVPGKRESVLQKKKSSVWNSRSKNTRDHEGK